MDACRCPECIDARAREDAWKAYRLTETEAIRWGDVLGLAACVVIFVALILMTVEP